MQEPKKKMDIYIISTDPVGETIRLVCDDAVAEYLKKFGTVRQLQLDHEYLLSVDPRYSFDEVREYVVFRANEIPLDN